MNSEKNTPDYKDFRSFIEHEDNLINQRINWNILINSFIFGSYAIVINDNFVSFLINYTDTNNYRNAIILAALFVNFITYIGAVAAFKSTRNNTSRYYRLYYEINISKPLPDKEPTDLNECIDIYNPILSGRFQTSILGLMAAIGIPCALSACWIMLIKDEYFFTEVLLTSIVFIIGLLYVILPLVKLRNFQYINDDNIVEKLGVFHKFIRFLSSDRYEHFYFLIFVLSTSFYIYYLFNLVLKFVLP